MNRKHVLVTSSLFALVGVAACTDDHDRSINEDDRLIERYAAGTVMSQRTGEDIEAAVTDTTTERTATLMWNVAGREGSFGTEHGNVRVSMSSELEPTLYNANTAAYLLWRDFGAVPATSSVSEGTSYFAGCECHWDGGACGGSGAVSCGCVWSDIASTCCGASC